MLLHAVFEKESPLTIFMKSAIRRGGGQRVTFHHPFKTRLLASSVLKPTRATNHGTEFKPGEAHASTKPFRMQNGTK